MTELLSRWPRLIGDKGGELLGQDGAVQDRFLVLGAETSGRLTLIEHRLPPRSLAAPLHSHTLEDEFSWILEGTVGAVLGGREIVAHPGELVIKPRGEWHTFWNAGDAPARVFEIIAPAGIEELFRILDLAEDFDMETLPALAAQYGCHVDMEGTMPIVERHGLNF